MPPPTRAEAEVANRLLEHGPIVSPPGPSGVFQVRAFIRPGWPITVDFAPKPNTRTYLRVSLATSGSLPGLQPARTNLTFEIDHDGRGGRRALTVGVDRLPPAADRVGGPAVRIADYAIESYRLDETGQFQRNGDYSVGAPVQIFGFGAGPRALAIPNLADLPAESRLNTDGMLIRTDFDLAAQNIAYQSAGSISIADVNLGPQAIHRPTANAAVTARFSYVAKQEFYQIDADIWRECDGVACTGASATETFTARPDAVPDRITGAWVVRPSTAPGLYDLYVRAWLHCNGAPADAFHDCADEAAWAYGHAGPIQVLP